MQLTTSFQWSVLSICAVLSVSASTSASISQVESLLVVKAPDTQKQKIEVAFGSQPFRTPKPHGYEKYERLKRQGSLQVVCKAVKGHDAKLSGPVIVIAESSPVMKDRVDVNVHPDRRYLVVTVTPRGILSGLLVLRLGGGQLDGTLVTARVNPTDEDEQPEFDGFHASTALYDVTDLLDEEQLGTVPFTVHKMFAH